VSQPATIILVGAGHAHLHVVAHAESLIQAGARVVLVDPGKFWYSGLATGMLGGMYEPHEDQVDLHVLSESHGFELIQDRVTSVQTNERRIRLADRGDLAYDYLSINVGSRVKRDIIAGAENDPTIWAVKPISELWRLRQHLEEQFRAGQVPRVAVVGGGATGTEVAANVLALAARHEVDLRVNLVTHGDRLAEQAPAGAARALHRNLARRGLIIRTRTKIVRREGELLIAEDGNQIHADLVVLAIGLEASPLVHTTGLPTHPTEGIRINGKLHSIADERVFAAGDCASMEGHDLPKLGVFGVRQAAYIHANLLASLRGEPLSEYQPQRRYLAILNLGDGTALSTWGPFWWNGRWSMWLKDFIDRRFLEGYRRDRSRG